MKKIQFIVILIGILFLSACSKDIRKNVYTLERGNLSIMSASEILEKFENDKVSKRIILRSIFEPENSQTLDTSYRIDFPFKIVEIKLDSSSTTRGLSTSMMVDLCKNDIKIDKGVETDYTDLDIEVILGINDDRLSKNNDLNLFISLDRLKEKKLMPQDSEMQEDLCVYQNSLYDIGWDFKEAVETNVLRFKAEEINNIRAEIEELIK